MEPLGVELLDARIFEGTILGSEANDMPIWYQDVPRIFSGTLEFNWDRYPSCKPLMSFQDHFLVQPPYVLLVVVANVGVKSMEQVGYHW